MHTVPHYRTLAVEPLRYGEADSTVVWYRPLLRAAGAPAGGAVSVAGAAGPRDSTARGGRAAGPNYRAAGSRPAIRRTATRYR